MLVVGLTGGIGSGKTAASDWFAAQDIVVVDADVIAREVVRAGSPVLTDIVQSFGQWVLNAEGALNRPALRDYIFNTPAAREKLESITHPAIRDSIKTQIQSAKSHYVILSVPLLFEGGDDGLQALCDRVLVIDLPEALQKQRAASRDKQTPAQIDKIMQVQMSRQLRLSKADDVADNSRDLSFLYTQLAQLHQSYLQMVHPC